MEACISAFGATSSAWDEQSRLYEQQASLLRAAREKLAQGYEELKEQKDNLVHENDGTEVSDTDLIKINAGGRALSATRRTLTQIKDSRLEAIFSGRWENRLLRDGDGRVFLDVNADSFQAIIDYLTERMITPPDTDVDPPNAGEENKFYLQRLLCSLGLDDLVPSFPSPREQRKSVEDWERLSFEEFPEKLERCLKAEQRALISAQETLLEQKRLFQQEKETLSFFVGGHTTDIVWLDVSGDLIAVKRSILGVCKESVLAKQFNDPHWEKQQGDPNENVVIDTNKDTSVVEDWSPEKVESWAQTIKGVPSEATATLLRNEISGVQLLALEREDFQGIGIKAGAIAVLTNAIKELQQSNEPDPTFIECSSYCFGKIVDQLRMLATMNSPNSTLPAPLIKEPERKRFKTVVEYYFPGESASIILGEDVTMATTIFTTDHSRKMISWLEEDGVPVNSFELLYRASRNGWGSNNFHNHCDNRGSTVTLVRTTTGYIFGGFTDTPWSRKGEYYKSSPKAFLYGMKTHSSSQPTKLRQVTDTPTATVNSPSHGPTFGAGPDLNIPTLPNRGNTCYSRASSYIWPSGQNSETYFTGSSSFELAELEVFRVV